jgi:hypothetical protein
MSLKSHDALAIFDVPELDRVVSTCAGNYGSWIGTEDALSTSCMRLERVVIPLDIVN